MMTKERLQSNDDTCCRLKKWIILAVIILILVIIGIGVRMSSYACTVNAQDIESTTDITIEEGMGVKAIAAYLEEKNLVTSVTMFQYCAWKKEAGQKMQAGPYTVASNATHEQLIDVMTKGDVQDDTVKLTIVEGLTRKQMATTVAESGLATEEEFLGATARIEDWSGRYPILEQVEEGTLEGYLFPDTYFFDPEVTAVGDIVEKMLKNYTTKLTSDLEEKLKARDLTLHEAMTLASIVEREANNEEDAKKIARVFLNRLSIGMRLQSDATVNYTTGKKDPQATLEDIKLETPYNTYVIDGLPVGPISNPGIAAIKAVAENEDHDFFYFLNDLETGEAHFAKNQAGHNANREKYLD